MNNIFFLIPLIFITSCSTIHVYDKSGNTTVTNGLGYVNINNPSGQDGLLVKLHGFGFSGVAGNISIGYIDLTMAGINPTCRAVFWVENESQAEKITSILGLDKEPDICFVNEHHQKLKW